MIGSFYFENNDILLLPGDNFSKKELISRLHKMEIEFNPNEKLKKYYIDKYNQYILDNNLRLKIIDKLIEDTNSKKGMNIKLRNKYILNESDKNFFEKDIFRSSYYSNFSNQNKETFPRKENESLDSKLKLYGSSVISNFENEKLNTPSKPKGSFYDPKNMFPSNLMDIEYNIQENNYNYNNINYRNINNDYIRNNNNDNYNNLE